MIGYTIVRSNRKTLALYIRSWGIEVRAPLKMPGEDIQKFVKSKEKWIAERQAYLEEAQRAQASFSLDYGSSVVYCGRMYPIEAKPGERLGFDDERFYMPPDLNPEQIKRCCIQIYRLLAKRDLTNKVIEFAKIMSVKPKAVRITGAKGRWGSYSSGGNISFAWRLIMAGEDMIDYVVVHELAHLKEMNHSNRFWAIVGDVFPDCQQRRERLNELQHTLNKQDWD